MTPGQRKALNLIADVPGIAPRLFAQLYWPDGTEIRHSAKQRAAGAILANLRRRGWITDAATGMGVQLTALGLSKLGQR